MYNNNQYTNRQTHSTGGAGQQQQNNNNNNPTAAHWEGAFIHCNQCLQPISNCRNVLTPCLHCFCYPCAQQQFALTPGCPICKMPFDPSKDVRCISTNDNDAKEYGRRLCTFTPRQLIDIFTYATKFWCWQQQLNIKLKAQQTQSQLQQNNSNNEQLQQMKQHTIEMQQVNNDLNNTNQTLLNSEMQLQRYIKQLESHIQQSGGSLPNKNSHNNNNNNASSNRNYEQSLPRQIVQQTPAYPQTPASYRNNNITSNNNNNNNNNSRSNNAAPFTPFVPSTRTNQATPHPSNIHQHLPSSTPAVFGMGTVYSSSFNKTMNGGETPHAQHTSYSNGVMTPMTPASVHSNGHGAHGTAQQHQQQQNISSTNVLGDRARFAATRRAHSNNSSSG